MRNTITSFSFPVFLLSLIISVNSLASNLPDELLTLPMSLMSGEQTSLSQYSGKKQSTLEKLLKVNHE